MARVLISEPHSDVRRLLESMVTCLGHEPLVIGVPAPQHFTHADVLMVEPTASVGAVIAQAASIAVPSLPIICVSMGAPPPELERLGVNFAVCLVKPFALAQLRTAIDKALLTRPARRRYFQQDQSAA